MSSVSWLTTLTILSMDSCNTCTYFVYFKSKKELNRPFSITTRHTVSNAELFLSDHCYTLFNDNTPHSEQRWTVLIRQLCTRKLVQAVYYDRFVDLNILGAVCLVYSDLRIYRISFFLLDLIFTRLKLCLADAIHNFRRVKNIQIWQNEGLILLIGVTCCL